MRIRKPGIERSDETFRFTFDGDELDAYPGESVAAAMIANGQLVCRESSKSDARGIYCGMGVCGECRVLVNGVTRRACMSTVEPDMIVEHYPVMPVAAAADQTTGADWRSQSTDVLVIGGGPAGMAAATEAAKSGLKVLLVDERKQLGGQYFKQAAAGFTVDAGKLDEQFVEGREMMAAAIAAGVELRTATTVWAAYPPAAIAVIDAAGSTMIQAKRIVIATGAFERSVPVAGWTLPGFMTTGAAQTLLRAYQTAPGKRVIVAGNGPLNLQVACELATAGIDVVAVAELGAAPIRSPLAGLRMLLSAPGLTLAGIRQLWQLRKLAVPILYRHALVHAAGEQQVRTATLARISADGSAIAGTEIDYDVDAVCVNHGFLPQSELARALGCSFSFDVVSGQLLAERDDSGRSNVPEVYIIGDSGGLGGARLAVDQGALAGLAIADELGAATRPTTAAKHLLKQQISRHRSFQSALWQLFAAANPGLQHASSTTLICRCESLDRASLEQAIGRGNCSLGALKRASRAGMGHCQGRNCMLHLATLLQQSGCSAPTADELFAPRAPFKPVPLEALTGNYGTPLDVLNSLRTNIRSADKTA